MNHPLFYVIQSIISIGVFVTIILNGRDKLYGWLLGAFIQVLQASYGLVTGQLGYLLAIIPGTAFMLVFERKRQERKQPKPLQWSFVSLTDEQYEKLVSDWLQARDYGVLPKEVIYQNGIIPRPSGPPDETGRPQDDSGHSDPQRPA